MLIFLKSPSDLEHFVETGRIAGDILSKLLAAVQPGSTPKDIDFLAREECQKSGVKPVFLGYMNFNAAICVSVNEGLVHGLPSNRPFNVGDLVSIDIGTDLNGYIGDTADTVIVGGVARSKEEEEVVLRCRDALKRAISVSKPGRTFGDIGNAVAEERRFGIVTNYGGHGIDRYKLHSRPFVANEGSPGSGPLIRPGMVFAIEPMLVTGNDTKGQKADDGWTIKVSNGVTAHAEHTIAITEDGPLVLTKRNEIQ